MTSHVSTVSGFTSGNTYTAGAGSNRLIVILNGNESDDRYITGVTWNGNAVGSALLRGYETGAGTRGITSWVLKESDITGNDGGALSISYNTVPAAGRTHIVTLANAPQTYTPTDSDTTDGGNSGTSATRTITVPTGGLGLAFVVTNWDAGVNFTWTNATEVADASHPASGARSSVAYTTTAGDIAMQADWTDSVGHAMIAFTFDSAGASAVVPSLVRTRHGTAFSTAIQRF